MTAASTGVNEKYLKKQDINYKSLFIIKADHAGYYPGASDIYFKILFEPETGKIFGAQAVGEKGADKKIDIIATAILGDISVYKLKDLETAYAPPFNSAKDIINYASYMAENIKRDGLETVSWNETDKIGLIDVRTEDEYNIDHIQNAVNMPLNTLRENMGKLDKNKEYIVYCKVGQRGYNAQRILVNNGYKVKNLNGGFSIYKSALMPQDNRIKFENDIFSDNLWLAPWLAMPRAIIVGVPTMGPQAGKAQAYLPLMALAKSPALSWAAPNLVALSILAWYCCSVMGLISMPSVSLVIPLLT